VHKFTLESNKQRQRIVHQIRDNIYLHTGIVKTASAYFTFLYRDTASILNLPHCCIWGCGTHMTRSNSSQHY